MRRVRFATVGLAAASLMLTACAESERSDEGGNESGGTFVFAGAAEPKLLDPFFASDGETFRVARQMFEGLVGTEPGTPDPAPLLAESWDNSEDGLEYTFKLRDGVKFHDGTEFDAEAVCANFDRWYNFPAAVQTDDFTYYYAKLFRGFATGEKKGEAIYDSCEATDDLEATINLKEPVRRLRRGALAAGVLDAEPDRPGEVPGRRGGERQRPPSTRPRTRRAPARSSSTPGTAATGSP